jgi:hypothetical protein
MRLSLLCTRYSSKDLNNQMREGEWIQSEKLTKARMSQVFAELGLFLELVVIS